jgi:hypothetical protein
VALLHAVALTNGTVGEACRVALESRDRERLSLGVGMCVSLGLAVPVATGVREKWLALPLCVGEAEAEGGRLLEGVLQVLLEGVKTVLEEGEPVLHALGVSAGDALVDSMLLDVTLVVSVGAL